MVKGPTAPRRPRSSMGRVDHGSIASAVPWGLACHGSGLSCFGSFMHLGRFPYFQALPLTWDAQAGRSSQNPWLLPSPDA
jgi:hypothetical protein